MLVCAVFLTASAAAPRRVLPYEHRALIRCGAGLAESAAVAWPVDPDGYYDGIITASTSDGFTRRYAGRIS